MFALADQLASNLSMALRQRDRVTFCVPGGTTPGPVFDILSDVRLDWERVTVLLNDERWVPESHERSNAAQLRHRLLTGRAAKAEFVPFYAPVATPEEALPALASSITPLLPISVLLLGMGVDMHTASLFPGADRLQDALAEHAPAVLPMRAPGAAEPRMTLTAPVLSGALNTHILITGQDKRDAIEAAAELPPDKAPVRVVLDDATVHWAP
jgi:6-phosphogluconolactonase